MKNLDSIKSNIGFAAIGILLAGFIQHDAYAVNSALIDRGRDGSRSSAVHRIQLYDAAGEKISIDDDLVLPFSTRMTCGECHDYSKIEKGWHFSLIDEPTGSLEPGEPWILTDERTGTQIPVSTRGWKGTWKPAEIGLSPWKFVESFGSHLTGGGLGEQESDSPDLDSKWHLSGKLEINCLACHSGSPAQDQSEWATQIERQNFSWAATAASGLASVDGSVASLPDTYDIYDGPDLDDPSVVPPSVDFNPALLDKRNKAFFDVVAKPSNDRCYFCHSHKPVGQAAPQVWQLNEDVHLNSGLSCVDCHRNGLDHQITRGRGTDTAIASQLTATQLSCEGCHLDEGGSGGTAAPFPKHAGLPSLHFEKMTCTTCHSGAMPGETVGRVHTARAHKMGTHTNSVGELGLPQILSPVFVKREDGKIEPRNMVWPSFWGNLEGDTVTPILPETVFGKVGEILQARIDDVTGTESILTLEKISDALKELNQDKDSIVFVGSGTLYKLENNDTVQIKDHPAAAAYSWPIAHDVRPAGQSLGSGGCTDCHSKEAPFFFASLQIPTFLQGQESDGLMMCDLQQQDENFQRLFGLSFQVRPLYKAIGFGVSGLLGGILLLYGLLGLRKLCVLAGRGK